jgi:hypothetical protein
MRLVPAEQLSAASNSICLSTAAALQHQRRIQQHHSEQHCNISDMLQTASVQHHPAAHLCVNISVSCSNLGGIERQLQLQRSAYASAAATALGRTNDGNSSFSFSAQCAPFQQSKLRCQLLQRCTGCEQHAIAHLCVSISA